MILTIVENRIIAYSNRRRGLPKATLRGNIVVLLSIVAKHGCWLLPGTTNNDRGPSTIRPVVAHVKRSQHTLLGARRRFKPSAWGPRGPKSDGRYVS